MAGTYIEVPLDVAEAPLSGQVICGSWWPVTAEGSILVWSRKALPDIGADGFSPDLSPQCNTDRKVVERVGTLSGRGLDVRQVPVVFMSSVTGHVRRLAEEARAEAARRLDHDVPEAQADAPDDAFTATRS